MRRISETVVVGFLATVMLGGCDWQATGASGQANVPTEPAGSGNAYLDKTAIQDETQTGANNAVDAAMEWARKYAEVSAKQNRLIQDNRTLLEKQKEDRRQIIKIRMELSRAEKELNEANEMLLEMRGELEQWKTSVLGFRDEMRRAQKAQLDAMTKILMLVGGEIPAKSPTTRPAALSAGNTEEKTGEKNQ